jgi:hypothetical protein
MPFQQRTNTSCQLALPTHGFTVVLSVFKGTPPAKPFNCKIRFLPAGDAIFRARAHHIGECHRARLAKFNWSPADITWMSRYFCSQSIYVSFTAFHACSIRRENKKPCLHSGKQGERNPFCSSEPAYAAAIQFAFGSLPDRRSELREA